MFRSPIAGIGKGIAAWLQAPNSANLADAITDETGSGSLVFATSPTITTPNIIGTNTNNDAAAGSVGENISGNLNPGSAVSLTSVTAANITSISLTAGDWDVNGWVVYTVDAGGTTNVVQVHASISTTSATINTATDRITTIQFGTAGIVPGGSQAIRLNTGTCRISIASTTTIYLIAFAQFGVSTLTGCGHLRARRPR